MSRLVSKNPRHSQVSKAPPAVRAIETNGLEELIKGRASTNPRALLRDAVDDLESCPERSSRVEDAIRLITKELMPRIARTSGHCPTAAHQILLRRTEVLALVVCHRTVLDAEMKGEPS